MRTIALAALLAVAGSAHAGWITVEPDNYAHGANVSNVVPGISLSAVQRHEGPVVTYSTFGPIYSAEGGFGSSGGQSAVTGTRVFAYDDGTGLNTAFTGANWDPPDIPGLRVDFAGGVSNFEFLWSDLECADATTCGDYATAWMYDASDNLIGVCGFTAPTSGCSVTTLGILNTSVAGFSQRFDSSSANIAYAVLGGSIQIDRIRTEVPEPGTLALLGAGMLALALRKKHKHIAT